MRLLPRRVTHTSPHGSVMSGWTRKKYIAFIEVEEFDGWSWAILRRSNDYEKVWGAFLYFIKFTSTHRKNVYIFDTDDGHQIF